MSFRGYSEVRYESIIPESTAALTGGGELALEWTAEPHHVWLPARSFLQFTFSMTDSTGAALPNTKILYNDYPIRCMRRVNHLINSQYVQTSNNPLMDHIALYRMEANATGGGINDTVYGGRAASDAANPLNNARTRISAMVRVPLMLYYAQEFIPNGKHRLSIDLPPPDQIVDRVLSNPAATAATIEQISLVNVRYYACMGSPLNVPQVPPISRMGLRYIQSHQGQIAAPGVSQEQMFTVPETTNMVMLWFSNSADTSYSPIRGGIANFSIRWRGKTTPPSSYNNLFAEPTNADDKDSTLDNTDAIRAYTESMSVVGDILIRTSSPNMSYLDWRAAPIYFIEASSDPDDRDQQLTLTYSVGATPTGGAAVSVRAHVICLADSVVEFHSNNQGFLERVEYIRDSAIEVEDID